MHQKICVNEHGRRIGESHHNARVSDADVYAIRKIRVVTGATYKQIADWFGVTPRTVKAYCRGEIRAQTAVMSGHVNR